jgi:hypothetical protein
MNKIALCFLPLFCILILSSSCTLEKRKYLSGYNFEWKNEQSTSFPKKKQVKGENDHDSLTKNEFENVVVENGLTDINPELLVGDLSSASSFSNSENLVPKDDFAKYIFKADTSGKCDNIILGNGKEIAATVTEVGTEEIRYKKCNTPDGPIYKLKRSEVFMIKYQNGTKDIITPANKETQVKKTEGFGLVSFIIGMIGGLPLGILALIFGVISLSRFKKEPGKYKGKGFAIAGAILGLIGVFLLIYLLAFAF